MTITGYFAAIRRWRDDPARLERIDKLFAAARDPARRDWCLVQGPRGRMKITPDELGEFLAADRQHERACGVIHPC